MTDLRSSLSSITDRRRVAVLPIRGVIGGPRTADTERQLTLLRRNGNVRGVLLDIDSPGGAAIASDALHVGVSRLAQSKPVLAWIRGTGASGAYFLACGATRIVAFSGAIVGSIGVISVRPIVADLLERLGAGVEVTKTGEFKDLGAPWRRPREADREREQQLVNAIFRRFTGAVSAARGLSEDRLSRVATGEVWLADEARDLGLVDDLVDHEDAALSLVHEMAGIPRRDPVRAGRRISLAQRLGVPGSARADLLVQLAEEASLLALRPQLLL